MRCDGHRPGRSIGTIKQSAVHAMREGEKAKSILAKCRIVAFNLPRSCVRIQRYTESQQIVRCRREIPTAWALGAPRFLIVKPRQPRTSLGCFRDRRNFVCGMHSIPVIGVVHVRCNCENLPAMTGTERKDRWIAKPLSRKVFTSDLLREPSGDRIEVALRVEAES